MTFDPKFILSKLSTQEREIMKEGITFSDYLGDSFSLNTKVYVNKDGTVRELGIEKFLEDFEDSTYLYSGIYNKMKKDLYKLQNKLNEITSKYLTDKDIKLFKEFGTIENIPTYGTTEFNEVFKEDARLFSKSMGFKREVNDTVIKNDILTRCLTETMNGYKRPNHYFTKRSVITEGMVLDICSENRDYYIRLFVDLDSEEVKVEKLVRTKEVESESINFGDVVSNKLLSELNLTRILDVGITNVLLLRRELKTVGL